MKFSAALSTLLGASAVLASPKPRSGAPFKRSVTKKSIPKVSAGLESNVSNVEYSSNWSGAVLVGTGYTSVKGTVVVPTIPASSSSTEKVGTAWVGIDGDTCSSLWQTGISWYVQGSKVTYDAWYEWVPYSASGKQVSVVVNRLFGN